MNPRSKKIILLLLAAVMLFSSGQLQKSLNRDRSALGLTISEPLQNAPPLLAFTTVALGGFRGLISNFLWIRAEDLQLDDKYFESAQLADWITDLEPHFAQVWVFQAWNMAYNISVKFKENAPGDYTDRWRWVERGIELLRDQGLNYNPNDVLIYRELAWFFQHKMGQNLDDGNMFYKVQWAREMTPFFGANGTNFSALISPQTPQEKTNALVLREKYKIDPVFAQKTDAQYGPLDWRLPEAHAIYWAARGLENARENPGKVKQDDLIMLRRNIYQSMLQAFHHGRIIADPFNPQFATGPNLELVSKVNDAYETLMQEDEKNRDHIATAHRNFLKDAVYFLYSDNRIADAARWYKILGEKYPDKGILDGDPNSFPRNLTLDDYAVARIQSEFGDTSQERTTAMLQGLIAQSYYAIAISDDDRAAGFQNLAKKVYQHFVAKTSGFGNNEQRVRLPAWNLLNQTVLDDLLNTQQPVLPYAARAVIRTQLGMPAESSLKNQTDSTNPIAPATLPESTSVPATNSAK